MADIIFTGEFTDDAGNDCKVDIHKVGYSGASAALVMGSNPVTIKTVGSNDSKFQHIVPTEAYIEVVSSSFLQFIDFFTLTQKTFYVDIYRGTSLIWQGWVNPEYYTEEFSTSPHTITISAIDGLAELKNVLLPIPEVVALNFKQNALYYIVACLNEIGLITPNRNIHAIINLVAEKYDGTLIPSRILESMYFDFRALQDENGDMYSCYDVLNEILASINARIYQNDFHWVVERIDHKYTDYVVEYYSIGLGTYIGNATENETMALTANLGYGDTIRFKYGTSLEIQPAAKKFIISQNYNIRSNLLPGVSYKLFQPDDFDETDGKLKYWEEYLQHVPHKQDTDIEDCLLIQNGTRTGYLRATVNLEDEGVDDINDLFLAWKHGKVSLILTFDIGKRFPNKISTNYFRAGVNVRGKFTYNYYTLKDKADTNTRSDNPRGVNSGGTTIPAVLRTVYNSNEATFEPSADGYGLIIDLSENDDFISVNYKVNAPPDEELNNFQTAIEFIVSVQECGTDIDSALIGTDDGLLYKNFALYFQENFTEKYARDLENVINEGNVMKPENYEVQFGSTPDNEDNGAMGVLHKHTIFDSNGKILWKFGYTGDTSPYTDLTKTIITIDLSTTYRRPQLMLNGTLLNTTLGIDNNGMLLGKILKDYDDRYYAPLNISYNMRSLEFDSVWICIYDDGTTGEFNDDFNQDFFI